MNLCSFRCFAQTPHRFCAIRSQHRRLRPRILQHDHNDQHRHNKGAQHDGEAAAEALARHETAARVRLIEDAVEGGIGAVHVVAESSARRRHGRQRRRLAGERNDGHNGHSDLVTRSRPAEKFCAGRLGVASQQLDAAATAT